MSYTVLFSIKIALNGIPPPYKNMDKLLLSPHQISQHKNQLLRLRLYCTGSLLIRYEAFHSLEFALYWCSFGAVQVQNCSSFVAGTNLYRITLSSVNARLIRNTFASGQKAICYSVNEA